VQNLQTEQALDSSSGHAA